MQMTHPRHGLDIYRKRQKVFA